MPRLERLEPGRGRRGRRGPELYDLLRDRQPDAIQRARRLAEDHRVAPHGHTPPADANPCTQVYLLVAALNAEIR